MLWLWAPTRFDSVQVEVNWARRRWHGIGSANGADSRTFDTSGRG